MSNPRKVFKEPLLMKADIDREWSMGLPLKNQDTSEQKMNDQQTSSENTIEITFFKKSRESSNSEKENK